MTVVINGTSGITDVNGSAAAPAITGTDTDTGVFFGTNTVSLSTGGTERLQIDSSGNAGLGVTPSAWATTSRAFQWGANSILENNNSAATYIGFNGYRSATGWKYITSSYAQLYGAENDGGFKWYQAASGTAGNSISFTQAMTLDASGNLGVGTTSPGNFNGVSFVSPIVDVLGSIQVRDGGANGVAAIQFGGTTYRKATIYSGNGTTDPYLGFATASSGSSSNATERARIDSSGSLFVGTSTTWLASASYKQGGLQVGNASYAAIVGQAGGTARYGIFYDAANTYLTITSGGTFYIYNTTNGVYLSANATSWTANSDERLKDIIEPITNAASKVSSLRAVIGKYKSDADGTRRSFLIAQDVQAVLPEAVSESQSKDQEETYLGLQYTEVIPLLVAAIKEQQAIIEQLQADVAALKGQA